MPTYPASIPLSTRSLTRLTELMLDDVCTDDDPDDGGRHSLLIRCNTTTGELAFYRCWAPRPTTLAHLIRPISDLAHRLHWSGWRRQHQARARRSHYTRRLSLELQP